MKYEQMVLGPALAYFHDAIVYEETTVDLLQNLPESECTPFIDELWNRVLRGHNTKKGVYGLLCNRYTMIGYRAMLEGDSEAHDGAEAVRAKLAFMEQKIYAGTEGMVADTVLTKWLAEFDNSKAKAVMTTTAKQAAGENGRMKIEYDDGDEEDVVVKEEKYRVLPSVKVEEQQHQVTATPWRTALLRHWTGELGGNQHSVAAAEMQAAALQKSTADNYERHWKKFVKFCTEENLQWLPATAATV
ncbi:hypothetical protein CYMTET_48401 [Cymbomonas tetramitiformis]|uniref:Uncharacterized protein n=1 Tax=Cymbomonas tetramitiformis TaxID=36881 RepID=A0AAE0BTF1_9CHLO|nr:hypothetical protein CYMTET_48401 [Cymbomonas tetramitiformis]